MSPQQRRLAALVAAFAPERAERLVALLSPPAPRDAVEYASTLARRPRPERLAALAAAFPAIARQGTAGHGHALWQRFAREVQARRPDHGAPSVCRTTVRAAVTPMPRALGFACAGSPGDLGTRRVPACALMALPFPVSAISGGFARLTPAAREAGRQAVASASRAVSELLGLDVAVSGQAVPAPAAPSLGVARVHVSLEALPCAAALEIETRLLARIVEQLAGSSPRTPGALSASEVEQSLLELIVLAALDGMRSREVDALVPRLSAGDAPGTDALVVALELTVGDDRGRGRALLPLAAITALAGAPDLPDVLADVAIACSLRQGTCSLAEDDLCALAAGDVLLLDEGPSRSEVVLPGGLTLAGTFEGEHLHLEEIHMTETQASYPITIAVEVARVTLTLGELARLEPGGALPLAIAKDGAVVLRAGERCIARGQLVDVDGALGVRLMQIGDRP